MEESLPFLHVLHVDDDPSLLEISKSFIHEFDSAIQITTTNSPIDAVEMVKTNLYDCLISDFQMPELDGITLTNIIRRFSQIPIIIYTGRGSEEVAENAFTAGVNDYIRKEISPQHFQVLAKSVRSAVESYWSQDLYRIVAEASPDGCSIKFDNVIIYANQTLANLFNLPNPSYLVGKEPSEWHAPEDRERLREMAINRQKGIPQPTFFHYSVIRADGQRRRFETNATMIRYRGRPASLSFTRDITEREHTESTIRESEKKYRQLVDSLNEGIWVIDKNAHTTFVNEKMAEMIGYTIEEMIGKHLFTFMDDEGKKIAAENIERRMKGIKEQHDFEFKHKNGTKIYAFLETAPIYDEKGEYNGAIAGVIDITLRRQMEEEIRNTDQLYRIIFDTSANPISITFEGKIIYANQSRLSLTSTNNDDLLGKECIMQIYSEDRNEIQKNMQQFTHTNEKTISYHYRIVGSDGKFKYIECTSTKIKFNKQPSFLHILNDVTERTKYEQKMYALSAASTRLVSANNLKEVAQFCLEAMENTLGFEYISFLIENDGGLQSIENRGAPSLGRLLPLNGKGITVRAFNTKTSQLVKDTQQDSDFIQGTSKSRSELAVPILIDNHCFGVLNAENTNLDAFNNFDKILLEVLSRLVAGALFKIQKSGEEKEIESKRASERINDALQVTRTAYHDLRNPLINMKSIIQLMKIHPEKNNDYINMLDKSINYAVEIIEDLQAISKPLQLNLKKVSLENMIEEIITTIHKPDTITLKKELIDVVILIDEIKMKRVFDNILKNAVESLTKNGVITIKNRVENEHVFITISDTGSGMSLEQKKNLYKPFFTSKENGTGLGLISCKKIVEAHGGIIEFESPEIKGTTFTITLPQNIPNY